MSDTRTDTGAQCTCSNRVFRVPARLRRRQVSVKASWQAAHELVRQRACVLTSQCAWLPAPARPAAFGGLAWLPPAGTPISASGAGPSSGGAPPAPGPAVGAPGLAASLAPGTKLACAPTSPATGATPAPRVSPVPSSACGPRTGPAAAP